MFGSARLIGKSEAMPRGARLVGSIPSARTILMENDLRKFRGKVSAASHSRDAKIHPCSPMSAAVAVSLCLPSCRGLLPSAEPRWIPRVAPLGSPDSRAPLGREGGRGCAIGRRTTMLMDPPRQVKFCSASRPERSAAAECRDGTCENLPSRLLLGVGSSSPHE
jgi:hypothetical protein